MMATFLEELKQHVDESNASYFKRKVEEIKEPLMREIRYLDKLIDELAKGKSMDKILRK